MDIKDLRTQMDEINAEIVELFCRRMKISEQIADFKRENHLPVYDAARERELLTKVSEQAGEEYESGARVLFSTLIELSRSWQCKRILEPSKFQLAMKSALQETENLFPEKAVVACQGTEGSYSQAACEKLFPYPSIMYFNSFDSVFSAIEGGLCRYGLLPVENSTAGSVNRIYDLMMKHNFNIVRSVRVQIDHVLLGKPGMKLSDVKEIISHEQAINQCSEYLKTLKNVKITVYENTALAAKAVAESDRTDLAAISSRGCAALYGLTPLQNDIQNNRNSYTRFICISKKLEIFPGADRTSMMMVIPHKPGSLYRVIARFYALGINITKLESRPIAGKDFEFMFYFDVNASVYSPALAELICELESEQDAFAYLGSYSEII